MVKKLPFFLQSVRNVVTTFVGSVWKAGRSTALPLAVTSNAIAIQMFRHHQKMKRQATSRRCIGMKPFVTSFKDDPVADLTS